MLAALGSAALLLASAGQAAEEGRLHPQPGQAACRVIRAAARTRVDLSAGAHHQVDQRLTSNNDHSAPASRLTPWP